MPIRERLQEIQDIMVTNPQTPYYPNICNELIQTVIRLDNETKELHNKIDKLEEYSRGNIEACENRLNSPFCNFERATKELMIHKNYLEILKDSEVNE